jgi:hypothetical protein
LSTPGEVGSNASVNATVTPTPSATGPVVVKVAVGTFAVTVVWWEAVLLACWAVVS